MSKATGPKILVFDIETSYMKVRVWDTGEQYVRQDQAFEESSCIAWSAKWLGDNKIMYMDLRKSKSESERKKMVKGLWDLLDKADIIVTKNGKRFDEKRMNSLFEVYELGTPSSYKHTDVEKIVRKNFYFPSYSLAYLSNKFNKKYKKLKHSKYPGDSLWTECLEENNQDAWKEMEKYNKYDVLSTEELYIRFRKWDTSINFSVYYDTKDLVCACGSKDFKQNGTEYTKTCSYKRYRCKVCLAPAKGQRIPIDEKE